MDFVVLVDENDIELGIMQKMQVHQAGLLHRAVSVIIFNTKGEMLLQQRSAEKYHSALLWTNACCTHPAPNEIPVITANRRLNEEMGLSCPLRFEYNFIYKAHLGNGLIEHEFDHVFFGLCDDAPDINPSEVADWRYISLTDLEQELLDEPEKFTAWFKLIFDRVKEIRK